MELNPLHDHVVIKADEAKEITEGGIYMPDTAQKKPEQGTVVAVGPGKTEKGILVPLQVKLNDKVLFNKYAGTEILVGEEEYLICRENDILAILAD